MPFQDVPTFYGVPVPFQRALGLFQDVSVSLQGFPVSLQGALVSFQSVPVPLQDVPVLLPEILMHHCASHWNQLQSNRDPSLLLATNFAGKA